MTSAVMPRRTPAAVPVGPTPPAASARPARAAHPTCEKEEALSLTAASRTAAVAAPEVRRNGARAS